MSKSRSTIIKAIGEAIEALRDCADDLEYLLIEEIERNAGVEFLYPDPDPCRLSRDDVRRLKDIELPEKINELLKDFRKLL